MFHLGPLRCRLWRVQRTRTTHTIYVYGTSFIIYWTLFRANLMWNEKPATGQLSLSMLLYPSPTITDDERVDVLAWIYFFGCVAAAIAVFVCACGFLIDSHVSTFTSKERGWALATRNRQQPDKIPDKYWLSRACRHFIFIFQFLRMAKESSCPFRVHRARLDINLKGFVWTRCGFHWRRTRLLCVRFET